MPNHIESESKSRWQRLTSFLRTHTSLSVIIIAALLLEMTTAVMYYAAQNIIQETVELLVMREMDVMSLSIRNHLEKVEITLENIAWESTDDLAEPDSLFRATYQLVEHNPNICGSCIACIPYLYPQLGRWFEPYAVRRADGTIESMQLGSASHDYTKSEFFTEPIAKESGHWSEPYWDKDGAKAIVTSYSVPVRDGSGKIVAVLDADISLDWLDDIINEGRYYKSTQRFLVTGRYNILAGEDSEFCSTLIEKIKVSGDQGYFLQEDAEGLLQHIFYVPVKGKTDWKIICVVEDEEAFGELIQVQVFLLLMVLSSFILLGFIVWRISRNLERLRIVNAEKERISSELRVASQIQQNMLPNNYLKQDDVEILGSLVPAREVGGDLFDYFIRDEKLFFCIGDVSGKGTPSAMLMSSTRSLFRAFSTHENNPALIMREVNEAACQGNNTNMFVTLFIGVLDLPTGHLHYCNAGHDSPFIGANRQWSLQAANPHLPIGVFTDVVYSAEETYLQPLSTIFLYTDGLTEAMNSGQHLFGLEKVKAVLESCTDNHPKELIGKMSEAVHTFVGEAEQSDDLTMFAIHYTPQHLNIILNDTLTLKNDLHEVAMLSSFQKSFFDKMELETSLSRQLRLGVEEAVVNVIEYAYPTGSEGCVEIRMTFDGHQLKVMIIDSGIPFDPTVQQSADTSLAIEDRQIGGLGILLIRQLMDTINYERIDGQNVLTLMKQINK